MKYLFDTDILSNLLRRMPSPLLVRRLATTPAEDQSTSSITVGELYYGARRLGAQGEELAKRIETILVANLFVFPFDTISARLYGTLRAELEHRGTPIGDADVRIASIALANQVTVVTANTRHFRLVPGLAIENWLE